MLFRFTPSQVVTPQVLFLGKGVKGFFLPVRKRNTVPHCIFQIWSIFKKIWNSLPVQVLWHLYGQFFAKNVNETRRIAFHIQHFLYLPSPGFQQQFSFDLFFKGRQRLVVFFLYSFPCSYKHIHKSTMNKQMFDNNTPLQAMNSLRCVRERSIEFVHLNGCNTPKPCGKFKHLEAIKGWAT